MLQYRVLKYLPTTEVKTRFAHSEVIKIFQYFFKSTDHSLVAQSLLPICDTELNYLLLPFLDPFLLSPQSTSFEQLLTYFVHLCTKSYKEKFT